jgi:histidine ammonia-lyase
VIPYVPERGSVGASGDLAPLAHLALLLLGEGDAFLAPPGAAPDRAPERLPAREALRRAGLAPVELQPKEGLALVNGTQAMAAVGTLALLRAEHLAELADLAGAMTLEGLLGSHRPFAPEIQAVRGQPGQIAAAARLRGLLDGSELNASHQGPGCHKVQDPYSLRCMPQVHGAARDGIGFCRGVLAREVNAATDNPLVFPDSGEIVSGGNFHGQPVALALDVLAIASSHLAAISERRVEQLVNPSLSGLPPFLAPNVGLDSGFMIAQVTSAALVSGEQGPVPPRLGGLHPFLGGPRGPRLHGHGGGAQGAAGGGERPDLPRDRAARGGAGDRPARAAPARGAGGRGAPADPGGGPAPRGGPGAPPGRGGRLRPGG